MTTGNTGDTKKRLRPADGTGMAEYYNETAEYGGGLGGWKIIGLDSFASSGRKERQAMTVNKEPVKEEPLREEFPGEEPSAEEYDRPYCESEDTDTVSRGPERISAAKEEKTAAAKARKTTATKAEGREKAVPESGTVTGGAFSEREYTEVKDTATYRLVKGIGHFRAESVLTVIVIVACVVLGFACVVRYASIFDLTRHTRILQNENNKLRNKLIVEENSLELGEVTSPESIAAKLGMVVPSTDSVISIPASKGDVTRVYLADDEVSEDEADKGFYQSLLTFLGRIRYDD